MQCAPCSYKRADTIRSYSSLVFPRFCSCANRKVAINIWGFVKIYLLTTGVKTAPCQVGYQISHRSRLQNIEDATSAGSVLRASTEGFKSLVEVTALIAVVEGQVPATPVRITDGLEDDDDDSPEFAELGCKGPP